MTKNIVLVMGSFHKQEVDTMLAAAKKEAKKQGLSIVKEVWVNGSLEKPLALKRELIKDDVHGAAVLGIIEKGGTAHGLVMGQAVTTAILNLQLDLMKPIGLGILGPQIEPEQVEERLEPYASAAISALANMLK